MPLPGAFHRMHLRRCLARFTARSPRGATYTRRFYFFQRRVMQSLAAHDRGQKADCWNTALLKSSETNRQGSREIASAREAAFAATPETHRRESLGIATIDTFLVDLRTTRPAQLSMTTMRNHVGAGAGGLD